MPEVDLQATVVVAAREADRDWGRLQQIAARVRTVVVRQVREIRRHGRTMVVQTLGTVAGLPMAPVGALLVRLLRPWRLIRFGKLYSARIGHFAGNTEVYLCERDAGLHDGTFDVFFHAQAIANLQLMKMWNRTVRVTSVATGTGLLIAALARRWPSWSAHLVPLAGRDQDVLDLVHATPPHLAFTAEEDARGRAGLEALGIPADARTVCFAARDRAFLDRFAPGRSWQYHDFRDGDVRNYAAAVAEVAQRGYVGVRMGAAVAGSLPDYGPRIVDYAVKGRSEFMDIYLLSRCRFFVGDSAGLVMVPMVFRRPVVVVNYVPLNYVSSWGGRSIFIPKRLRNRDTGRDLTFGEILESGAGMYLYTEEYATAGLDVVENTAEEITAAVIEMDQRIDGTWVDTPDDDDRQARFWSLFDLYSRRPVSRSRIATSFLRLHPELLQDPDGSLVNATTTTAGERP